MQMIPLTLDDVLKHLLAQKYDAKLQATTKQLYFIHRTPEAEFPIFLKVDEYGTTLQTLLFLPCNMRPKAPPEVARLLHMLNKEIDLPGFGMDENANVIFYRSVLFGSEKQIDAELLNNILRSMIRLGPIFLPIISAVAGGAYFEAVAADARKIIQQSAMK